MQRTQGIFRKAALACMLVAIGLPPGVASGAQPSDPLFSDQWALQPGAPLDVTGAWQVADGRGSIVAIVDSGVDMTHPDLVKALWTNPGEIPGNGIDDDHDGYVDDVHGVDIVDHDGDPTDSNGHGTHVAGIIAAQRNTIGGVGIAPGAEVMAIRVLGPDNTGSTADMATGIRYAIAHGATVINTSLNGDLPYPDLKAAIAEAGRAGIPVVASAGNASRNLLQTPSYPASYDDPDVLSVAAADVKGVLAAFSNFGSNIAVAAPGVNILSTARGGGYEYRSGTSMSAPATAAVFAVLHSARPDMTSAQLRAAMQSTARRPSALAALLGGEGEVDLVAALKSIVPAGSWPAAALTARVRRRARRAARTLVTWSVTGDSGLVTRFRVANTAGATLARKGASSRGAWVARRRGSVVVKAIGSDGHTVASAVVKLAG